MEKSVFAARLDHCYQELKWLYCELYQNDREAFDYFVQMLKAQWNARKDALRAIDERRLAEPDWYRSNKLLGMMLYPANFGGTLKGVQEKLPYLAECGVNYLHLMPLLDSPKGKSDGGYAVSDFRRVQPDLGTMEDLAELADACHEKGMVLCLDFVLNHTSEEQAWAKAAKAGDPVARSRYFFYDTWATPNEFEKTVPQVFPTTAPGNFTQLPDGQIVMTSFYPFQWDLNYTNPMVFNDMVENLLFLANQGMDVFLLHMPCNFAFLGKNKADDIINAYEYENWYIGGHSLGGAMAASYAADHLDMLRGVVLLSAYPTDSLKEGELSVLSIYGSEDKVLNMEKVKEGREYMPSDYTEICIDGGNHAQFGNYGIQGGDGKALIPAEEQQEQTVEAILVFFGKKKE